MRFVEIRLGGAGSPVVSLHPRLTVVAGLGPASRARLVDAVSPLRAGVDAGLSGLVDVHGVRFDLTPGVLDLLDVPADAACGLRRDELPGLASSRAATDPAEYQRRAAAVAASERAAQEALARAEQTRRSVEEAVLDARKRAAEARRRAEEASKPDVVRQAWQVWKDSVTAAEDEVDRARAELDRARQRRDEAEEAYAEAVAAAEAAESPEQAQRRQAREAAEAAVAEAEEALTRAEAALSAQESELAGLVEGADVAGARLAAAERAVEQAEAALAGIDRQAESPPQPGPGPEPLATEEALVARAQALAAELAAVDLADDAAFQHVAGALRQHLSAGPELYSQAERLAEALADVARRRAALEEAAGATTADIRQQLLEARRALADIEAGTRSRVSPEERSYLESAHEAVLGAQERLNRGLVKGKARREYEQAVAAERDLLARYGFTSYSDFLMSQTATRLDPATELRLLSAQAEVRRLEELGAALERAEAAGAGLEALLAEEDALARRAGSLLGPGLAEDELITGLRNLRHVGMSGAPLVSALALVGLPPGNDPVTVARGWLEEQAAARRRRDALAAELAGVRAELAALPERLAARERQMAAEQEAARVAAQRAGQEQADARAHLEGARAERDAAGEALRAAETALVAAQAGRDAAAAARVAAAGSLDAARAALEALLAEQAAGDAEGVPAEGPGEPSGAAGGAVAAGPEPAAPAAGHPGLPTGGPVEAPWSPAGAEPDTVIGSGGGDLGSGLVGGGLGSEEPWSLPREDWWSAAGGEAAPAWESPSLAAPLAGSPGGNGGLLGAPAAPAPGLGPAGAPAQPLGTVPEEAPLFGLGPGGSAPEPAVSEPAPGAPAEPAPGPPGPDAATAPPAAPPTVLAAAPVPEQAPADDVSVAEAELAHAAGVEEEAARLAQAAEERLAALMVGEPELADPARVRAELDREEADLGRLEQRYAAVVAEENAQRERADELARQRRSLATRVVVAGEGAALDQAAVEEIEFFVLARLAALRSVSFAGALPFVLDDVLGALPADARMTLLDRFDRMADAVQIVYLSDDPFARAWAQRLPSERAGVVEVEVA